MTLLTLTGCAQGSLSQLVVPGEALHPSLVTRRLEDAAVLHLAPVLRANPYLSSDSDFVNVIGRMSSQGRLDGRGVRSALYALHGGEAELGLYGLEAASASDAGRIERALRSIWAHNAGLGLAHVHRHGNALLVVWHRGVSPSSWEAANAEARRRMSARRPAP